MTIPVGGAAVSASNGALSSPVTITVPAANYYFNAAGGVSSLLSTFQQYLNDSVQGYPTLAAAMQAALGYGPSTGWFGWLINETAGNLAPAIGATTLTATSLVYGNGPRGGIDKAISFDAGTDRADGGNIVDITATDDLIAILVTKIDAVPASTKTLMSKWAGGATGGWQIALNSSGELIFQGITTAGAVQFTSNAAAPIGAWCVVIATIDRVTAKARLAVRTLAGATTLGVQQSPTATSLSGAAAFRLGDRADNTGIAPASVSVSAAYAVSGSGVATGLEANISTAITNLASAINSSFTVALGSDGRITISNSFWPSSIAWTNTSLRDVLGFEYDFDYPQTATQVTAALGGLGVFTGGAGYLLNESSGNALSVFGSPATLTAASTPTYSNPGARGGSDKAIGLDSAADLFSSGSSAFDVVATDDLALVWVAYHTATPTDVMFSKYDGGTVRGWYFAFSAGSVVFQIQDGTSPAASVAVPVNEWYVGVAALDRSTGKMRVGVQGLRTGTQTVSAETSVSASSTSNVQPFLIGAQTWFNSTSSLRLSGLYVVDGSGVATGLSTNLATALANFAAYMKGQTGTAHARGVWEPDCTLDLEGDPERAPLVTDARSTMSPTGQVITYVGNTFKRHRSILWSHVPAPQVWDAEAPYENGSWEEFLIETQFGLGSSWFKPGSLVQIYDHSGVRVGVDADVAGWSIVGINSIEPPKAVPGYTGLWRIEIPRLIAVGS